MLPANCLKQFPAQQPFFGTQLFICNNMHDQAILLYARIVNSSTSSPDPYTYSSTLKACAETRQIHIGKAVHCHILRSHLIYPPSRIVCNSLLSIYYGTCTSSSPSSRYDSLVSRVFDTIRKKQNVVAWNVIISWYVKKERFLQVMLMKTGLKPTVVRFVKVFPAIWDIWSANILYGMLIKMGGVYVNNIFAVCSAIFVYSELGQLDSARKIFDQCIERNTEVWNTMIVGSVETSFKNFTIMHERDDVSWNTMLSAFVQNGLDDEDLMLVCEMQKQGFAIDSVLVIALLSAASNLRNHEVGK